MTRIGIYNREKFELKHNKRSPRMVMSKCRFMKHTWRVHATIDEGFSIRMCVASILVTP